VEGRLRFVAVYHTIRRLASTTPKLARACLTTNEDFTLLTGDHS
jgi:hypothetical protein